MYLEGTCGKKLNEKLGGGGEFSVLIVSVSCMNSNKMPKIIPNYRPNGCKTTWEEL
jgi:hypothetical protein